MKHSIVIALSLLVGVCAFQRLSLAQTSPTDSAMALAANAPATPAEPSGASEAQMPAHNQPVASAADGSTEDAPTDSDAAITKIEVVPELAAETTRTCEYRQRPGSRMARKVCFTQRERLAYEAAREKATKDQLADLQREQRWRDELIREAQMHGRRPTGFGLGPD